MPENVKAVVVTYNSADCIAGCLNSLKSASVQANLSVTIIDNASADDTLGVICTTLNRSDERVEVIRNPENLGYARGNNLAIQSILSEGRNYAAVLILNPDVTLAPGALDRLLAVFHSSTNIGAVSPRLSDSGESPDGPVRFKSLWGWPTRKKFLDYEDVIEVDRLHGGCLLVKPDLFKEVGVFDESYFLYWEEIDLCQRARKAGFKLLLCNGVVVAHHGDSRAAQDRPHRVYYMWRNQFYFAFKSFGKVGGAIFLARRLLFSNVKEIFLFLWARRWDLIAAGCDGILAGLAGEKGRSSNRFANTLIAAPRNGQF
jgi:N-acetylglucosaminyl-diphospho-decaprenol L-rhamnosyltransferase